MPKKISRKEKEERNKERYMQWQTKQTDAAIDREFYHAAWRNEKI